jgi:GT2 family glycosyltransferase
MKIGVVTVTYNSSSVLEDFFTSIENLAYPDFNLYVIDNASSDDTISKIEDWSFESKILLKNTNNLGVAAGNNQGIKLALKDNCDFVLLLNNDTVFENQLLSKLLDTYRTYGSSIVVPKMNYFSPSNMIWYAGGFYNRKKAFLNYHRGQGETDDNQYNVDDKIEYAPTCCALVHKSVFEDVGLMDEKYFVYFDDTDFFYRVLIHGKHEVRYRHDIHFLHKIGSLTQSRNKDKPQKYGTFFIKQNSKNHVYFLKKQKTFIAYINLIYLWFYLTTRFFISPRFEKKWSVFCLIQSSYFQGFKM